MPQTNGWVCVGLYFFRFTFPDWLLLNLPPLSLFLNAMEGICDSGHIAIAVGRVTLLFQSWSWGTETLVRNLPKKSRFFPRFSRFTLVIKKKRIQTANVADSFFHLFPHFQLVRLHSAYWMIWQEWPPRWLLKDPPRVKGLKCDTCNSGLAVWVFHSGLERPVTWFFLSLCVSFGLVSFCSAPFHSFIHSSIQSFIHWWICDGFGVFPSLYTYMWAHISMSQN